MRVLIDLNVLLDVAQVRQPHFADSARVLSAVVRKEFEAWIAAHCLTTLHYLIEKHNGLAAADAAVDWHLKHFRVPALSEAVLNRARLIGMSDFEDAVVAASAEEASCGWIVTRNVSDFALGPVKAITPHDFLGLMKSARSP